ncbi:uncharacterized protein LOC144531151 [Sander vitreus]
MGGAAWGGDVGWCGYSARAGFLSQSAPGDRDTEMFTEGSIFLLCLVSVSRSAPLGCEVLVRPLNQLDPHHLEGRWALVADSLSTPILENPTGSMTVYFSNSSETSVYSYTQGNRLDDQCFYLFYNFSIESSTFTHNLDDFFNLTGSFLYTSCPDCLVIRWVLERETRASVDFYLFSRRRQLEQKEMEEFRAQVECLNMPPPAVMDPTKELCPKQTTSDPAAHTDAKTEVQKA